MPARRKLLITAAAAVVAVSAIAAYWAWDPVPLSTYVPLKTTMVIECKRLNAGLDRIHFETLTGFLPENIRTAVPLPHSSIGPGLDYMDILGTEFAVYATEETLADIALETVIVTRMSLKAKLAETVASLIGRTHRIRAPSGISVRVARQKDRDMTVYYRRCDRILIASGSLESVDKALSSARRKVSTVRPPEPYVSITINSDGLKALTRLAADRGYINRPILASLEIPIGMVETLNADVLLQENIRLSGSVVPAGAEFTTNEYRRWGYGKYSPESFAMVPGNILYAVSSGYPGLIESVKAGSAFSNTLFRSLLAALRQIPLFRGETAIVCRDGAESAYFVAVKDKLMWPDDFRDRLFSALRNTVGECSLFNRKAGGDVYRIDPLHPQMPTAWLWISRRALVACPDRDALDDLLVHQNTLSSFRPGFDRGDVFVVANPGKDPDTLSAILGIDPSLRPLLGAAGPVSFETAVEPGRIVFKGSVGLLLNAPAD